MEISRRDLIVLPGAALAGSLWAADTGAPWYQRIHRIGQLNMTAREVNSLYDVDGHYTNGWPPIGRFPNCYCEQCRKLAPPGSVEYWDQFTDRTIYLWKLYDSIAKEKRADSLYYANLGGGAHATPN